MPVPSTIIVFMETIVGISYFRSNHGLLSSSSWDLQLLQIMLTPAKFFLQNIGSKTLGPLEPSSVVIKRFPQDSLISSSSIIKSLFLNPTIKSTSAPILVNPHCLPGKAIAALIRLRKPQRFFPSVGLQIACFSQGTCKISYIIPFVWGSSFIVEAPII